MVPKDDGKMDRGKLVQIRLVPSSAGWWQKLMKQSNEALIWNQQALTDMIGAFLFLCTMFVYLYYQIKGS